MTGAATALLLSGLLAGPAASQPPPSAGQLRFEAADRAVKEGKIRYFPLKAVKPQMSGRAVVDCLVEPDGWLTDCRVVEEEPVGYDFGATALAMSPMMKARPEAAGRRIRAPFNFKPPPK